MAALGAVRRRDVSGHPYQIEARLEAGRRDRPVTTSALAASYLKKALLRLEMLRFAYEREGFSDVVPEAQELVELALKGMLRAVGVDPPKVHEVGATLLLERERFPSDLDVDTLARISGSCERIGVGVLRSRGPDPDGGL
jgi:HEPN domain-containing protein